MTDSGRLRSAASPQIRAMLLERPAAPRPAWKAELDRISLVDLAHVVMLAERGVTERPVAAALLSAIKDLRAQDFAPLETRPTPRGLYLAYEGYLIELLGEGVGGVLQTGRSRNDLNATCLQLALREPYKRLAHELTALGAVLTGRARRYRETLMPVYTHFQAAVPITLGHYLLGLAHAFERDFASLAHTGLGLERCPLGGGSVGGTTVPIDAERTAHLLGFSEPVANSVDAIASRDTALRMLSTCAILGVTLDRAALDLLMWSSAEFGMLTVPDGLVGSSSMMPQKRNAFVLEHVQGKSAAALGALTGALGAMRGTPFTNSIAVGTEAMSHVMSALAATADAVKIMRLAYQGIRPVPEVMERRATTGLTNATATAEWLVRQGVPFRSAHYQVGEAVNAVLAGEADSLGDGLARSGHAPDAPMPDLDPPAVWRAAQFGGGPGPASFDRAFGPLAVRWMAHRSAHLRRASAWDGSVALLMETADAVSAPVAVPRPEPVHGEETVRARHSAGVRA